MRPAICMTGALVASVSTERARRSTAISGGAALRRSRGRAAGAVNRGRASRSRLAPPCQAGARCPNACLIRANNPCCAIHSAYAR